MTDPPPYPNNSNYIRRHIGQSVTQPMDIRFDMLIDGKPYPFDDVSHEWPAKSYFLQNSDKSFSLYFGGRNGYQSIRLYISLKRFHGPGKYDLNRTDDFSIFLDDLRSGGDGYLSFKKISPVALTNFVEVTELDLLKKRAVGRFEMTLEWDLGTTRTLSATFDVPLIIPPPRPEATNN